MTTRKVKFNLIADVQEFVHAASRCAFDIDFVSGRYVVDAKSIMGIFSLDISKPIEMHIHADEEDTKTFLNSISRILV